MILLGRRQDGRLFQLRFKTQSLFHKIFVFLSTSVCVSMFSCYDSVILNLEKEIYTLEIFYIINIKIQNLLSHFKSDDSLNVLFL